MSRAPLIVLSGPSGSGKSTVVRKLLEESGLPLRQSVSVTTRTARPGEKDGKHYHFWAPERFDEHLKRGDFLEWAEVAGNRYGTLRAEVDAHRDQGVGVVLVIDVQGADQIRRQYPDCTTIFLRAPSFEVYRQRLEARGSEDSDAIARRVRLAREEERHAGGYDHVVVNDELDETVAQINSLIAPLFSGNSDPGGLGGTPPNSSKETGR
jgi:guanylate kinase